MAVGYATAGMAQQSTSGMAIASLVLGIFICLPLASVLAVIFGIVALVKTKEPGVGGRGMAIAGTVLGGLGLLIMPMIWIPAFIGVRQGANRARSAANLRNIEQAIVVYANNYSGDYPPDLGTLYKDRQLDLHLFVCPGTGNAPPVSMSIDQAVQWVNTSADYVYLGAGMKSPAPSGALVIYEKDGNHPRGDNVLYGDGRVMFLPVAAVHQLIAQNNYYGTSP